MKIDDISTGSFVVVESWHVPKREQVGSPFSMLPPHTVEVEDTRLLGIPLCVLGVSLPYVAVIAPGATNAFPIDTRRCALRRSNRAYFEACTPSDAGSARPAPRALEQILGRRREGQ